MKRLISERFALHAMMVIFSLTILFHLLVLSGFIPFSIVWGGRLHSKKEMLQFETVSLTVNLVLLLVVGIRSQLIRIRIPQIVLTVAFWFMALLFLLNTLGNLFSANRLEKALFTPVTFLLYLFSIRLALSQKSKTSLVASTHQ